MAIEFTEYDSISDQLFWFNDTIILQFVVKLSRKSKFGERIFYQYETKTGADKYGSPTRSIKRNMNFFFVIQNKNVFGNNFIMRPQDVEMIKMLIQNKVLEWFMGKKQAFRISKVDEDEEVLILNTVEPVTYYQGDGKYISFEPVLVYQEDKAGRGIRISFHSGDTADMSIDQFMGFYNIIANTDMYAVASTMCTYAKVPPYEINVWNNTGLGAAPANKIQDQPMFRHNSFLDNAKSKKE